MYVHAFCEWQAAVCMFIVSCFNLVYILFWKIQILFIQINFTDEGILRLILSRVAVEVDIEKY